MDALGFPSGRPKSHFIHGTTTSVRSVSSDFSPSFCSPFRFPTTLLLPFFSVLITSSHSSSLMVCLSLLDSLSLSLCSFFLSVFLSFVSWNVTRIWLLTRPGFHLYSRTSSENLKAKGEQKLGPSFCMCAQAWLFDTQASTSGRREILAVAHSSKDNVRILLIFFQRRSSTIATIWWMRKIFFYCTFYCCIFFDVLTILILCFV